SFILAGLGLSLGFLSPEAQDLILAGSILSIAFNPIAFAGIPVILRALRAREGLMALLESRAAPRLELPTPGAPRLENHAIIVGHGRVGGAITPLLEREGLPFIAVERDRILFERLRDRGIPAVYGDASSRGVLLMAGLRRARLLVVASPDGFQARRILEIARTENPGIETVVRTHSEEELAWLKGQGVGLVVMGEHELARGMGEHVLRTLGVPPARARLLVQGESTAELA